MEEKAKPVEVMPEKPPEEDLSWEDKEEKIGEEIKVDNETEPGNRKIYVALIYIAHDLECFTPSIVNDYLYMRTAQEMRV